MSDYMKIGYTNLMPIMSNSDPKYSVPLQSNNTISVQIVEKGLVLVDIALFEIDKTPKISLPNGSVSLPLIERAIKLFVHKRLNALWELEMSNQK